MDDTKSTVNQVFKYFWRIALSERRVAHQWHSWFGSQAVWKWLQHLVGPKTILINIQQEQDWRVNKAVPLAARQLFTSHTWIVWTQTLQMAKRAHLNVRWQSCWIDIQDPTHTQLPPLTYKTKTQCTMLLLTWGLAISQCCLPWWCRSWSWEQGQPWRECPTPRWRWSMRECSLLWRKWCPLEGRLSSPSSTLTSTGPSRI